MSDIAQKILKESMDENPAEVKKLVESALMERVKKVLEAKKSYSEEDDEEDDDEDLEESFTRGQIIEVPGDGNTKHKAVVISKDNAVYVNPDDEEGYVEPVPSDLVKKSTLSKRNSAIIKKYAKKFLENMKESIRVNGKTYRDYKTFNSDSLANEYMEKNPEYGVLTVDDGLVYVVKKSDLGE